jgi:hypothetical protein
MTLKDYKELFEKVKKINVYEIVFTKNDLNIILLAGDTVGFEPTDVTNFSYDEEEGSSLIELIFNGGVKSFEYDSDFVVNVVTDDKQEAMRIACKEVRKYLWKD